MEDEDENMTYVVPSQPDGIRPRWRIHFSLARFCFSLRAILPQKTITDPSVAAGQVGRAGPAEKHRSIYWRQWKEPVDAVS